MDVRDILATLSGVGESRVQTPAQYFAMIGAHLRQAELINKAPARTSNARVDELIAQHAKQYRDLLVSGKRVFVIAYSEGTLLVNAAKRKMIRDYPEIADRLDSFRIIHVASLAETVEDVDPRAYVTDKYDSSAAGMRLFGRQYGVLNWNKDNYRYRDIPWYDVFQRIETIGYWLGRSGGHAFVGYYMALESETRKAIFDLLKQQIIETPNICFDNSGTHG